jgi:hypothetical protein
MGRHSAPDDDGHVDTVPIAAETPKIATKVRAGTSADLHLLRTTPSLRARCAAAVVVPFLLYTLVLIVLGQGRLYLLWVWVPTVLAGILVGSFLDAAHRRANRAAESTGPIAPTDQR